MQKNVKSNGNALDSLRTGRSYVRNASKKQEVLHVYLIFESKAKADAIMLEIACTPFAGVWMYSSVELVEDELGNVTEVISPINGIQYAYDWQEIRCCVCHNFSEEDRAWLEIYLDGVAGVTIANVLPDDWYEVVVYPEVIVGE